MRTGEGIAFQLPRITRQLKRHQIFIPQNYMFRYNNREVISLHSSNIA
jgi:hypothetical protein